MRTGLLFDNRSVQSLLASHIALLGPMPQRMLSEGQLADHYFAGKTRPGESQTLVGKHEGRISPLPPNHDLPPTPLCERHGCSDPTFAEFIKNLLQVGIASVL